MARLLELPRQIQAWRAVIWDVLADSVYQRVQQFLPSWPPTYMPSRPLARSRRLLPPCVARRLPPALSGYLRTAQATTICASSSSGAIEYLSSFADGDVEMPVSIIRATNDVERMAQIEESALPADKQDVIRFCILQIARLAGENS